MPASFPLNFGAPSSDLGGAAGESFHCADKPVRRLLVQGLTSGDLKRVGVFLRIGRERLQRAWEVVFHGDADVLLLGSDEPETIPGALHAPDVTLRVVEAAAGTPSEDPCLLTRPLEYEPFVDALAQAGEVPVLERRIPRHTRTALKPPALSDVRRTVASAPTAVVSVQPAMDSPVAPAESVKVGAAGPAKGDVELPAEALFRLRRWPPTALLQGGLYNIRLASFLSARHVGLQELARMSNVGADQCRGFLSSLHRAGLLSMKAAVPQIDTVVPHTMRHASPTPATREPARTRRVDTSLISRLRRTLGLA